MGWTILARPCNTTKQTTRTRGGIKSNPGCRRSPPESKGLRAMPANKKLLILPGDGIGPEVMREVRRIIDWMDRRRLVTFDVSDDHVGGSAIDTYGAPITDETME